MLVFSGMHFSGVHFVQKNVNAHIHTMSIYKEGQTIFKSVTKQEMYVYRVVAYMCRHSDAAPIIGNVQKISLHSSVWQPSTPLFPHIGQVNFLAFSVLYKY